jgi:hypothetical protein
LVICCNEFGSITSGEIALYAAVIGALTAAITTSLLSFFIQRRKTKAEHRSLLLLIANEIVLNYERCVIYTNQAKDGVVSFSGIFNFTDSDTVARFVAVTKSPSLISAIMKLKFTYYQVGRHVENASKFAFEAEEARSDLQRLGSMSGEIKDTEYGILRASASRAQRTAIAFFTGAPHNPNKFDEVDRDMGIIVEATRKECPGSAAEDLHKQFEEKRKELRPFRPAKK